MNLTIELIILADLCYREFYIKAQNSSCYLSNIAIFPSLFTQNSQI
jgi:hypothetical protein